MRRALVLVASCALVVSAAAGTAWATTFQTTTSFGFAQNPDTVLGDVESPGPSACEQGRKVKLFLKRRGDDRLIDSDRSDAGGQWTIVHNLRNGRKYYARIPAKDLPGRDSCASFRTTALRFPSGTP